MKQGHRGEDRSLMRGVMIALSCLMAQVVCWPASLGADGHVSGIVAAHNKVRADLGLQNLVWSDDLAGYALEWAIYLSGHNSCRLKHRPKKDGGVQQYGENLYWASPVRFSDGTVALQEVKAVDVVATWAKEAEDYDYATSTCRKNRVCGHYTQVVWGNTKRVGCGRAVCADKGQIWVCNYDPPGNFIGQKPY